MKIIVSDTYEDMSRKAAHDLLEIIDSKKNPVLCTASGDSPAGMYKELAKEINERKIDISRWLFVSLDEWAGMNGDDEGSCRFHLNNQLFNSLHVTENNIAFFDGKKNMEDECERIESFINAARRY